MAAFLFFLSVALTVTNREDIRSTLLADHKMRAEFAADGALNYNLQLLRTQPNWEEQLQTLPFSSGARVTSKWRKLQPPAIELEVISQASLVTAERRLALEEFRLGDSLAVGANKPHLFAMRKTPDAYSHSVLGPNFKWQPLGNLQVSALPDTYVADGGPLFMQAKDEGTIPPTLQDWQPTIDALGVVVNGGFAPTSQQLPRGNGAWTGKLVEDKFSLELLPDPGDLLGRVKQATINGKVDGVPTFTTVTLAGQPTQLDTSEYQGPCVEWYLLTGTAAAAKDQFYYCHGRHIYTRGVRFRNTAGADPPGSVTPGAYYDEPCILRYAPEARTWSIVIDLLKVTDDLSEPIVVDGPRPDVSTLWITESGKIYCRQIASDDLVQVVGDRFQTRDGLPGSVLAYRDRLLSLTNDPNDGRGHLNQNDPAQLLLKLLPGRNLGARINVPDLAGITLEEEPPLDLFWSITPPITAAKKEIYAIVTCEARVHEQPSQPSRSKVKALAHFDGERWQILPSGLATVLPGSSFFKEVERDYVGKALVVEDLVHLALAGYPTSQPLLRRYSPLVHY